jgi:hypothetical protein
MEKQLLHLLKSREQRQVLMDGKQRPQRPKLLLLLTWLQFRRTTKSTRLSMLRNCWRCRLSMTNKLVNRKRLSKKLMPLKQEHMLPLRLHVDEEKPNSLLHKRDNSLLERQSMRRSMKMHGLRLRLESPWLRLISRTKVKQKKLSETSTGTS